MTWFYRFFVHFCKMSFILLLAVYLGLSACHTVMATDLTVNPVTDGSQDSGECAAPPSFADNNGISIIYDQRNGNWRLYFAPYLDLQAHESHFGGLAQGYLDWDNGKFGFSIGRKIVTLGPGRYGFPVLGPLGTGMSATGYDQIGYHFTWGHLKAQKFYALVTESSYRMLIGQRVTYDLGQFTLGVSECVLVNSQVPAYYYIPIPFSPNENTADDNKVEDFDFTWHINNNFKIYGQFFIDDIPFSLTNNWGQDQWSKWAWRCGYQEGFAWQNAFRNPALALYFEYTAINKYTYTKTKFFDWTHNGFFLGDSIGPDADRLNVELVWKKSPQWQWSFAYQRIRHGEGKIGDTFVPGQSEFLTGIVEATDLLAVGVTKKNERNDINLSFGLANIRNVNHVQGEAKLAPMVSVNARFYWP